MEARSLKPSFCLEQKCRVGPVFLLLLILTSCNTFITTLDPSVQETQLELNVQQTLLAQRATNQLGDSTQQAQKATEEVQAQQTRQAQQLTEPTIDPALAAQETVQIVQQTQAAEQTTLAGEITAQTPSSSDLPELIKTANILLFEDMVGRLDVNRYIKDTLEAMGILCKQDGSTTCKDDGSARGWLKDDLSSGAPDGKPWDLIIVAAENKAGSPVAKTSFPADYFDLILDAINQGTSAILEMGNLDEMHQGTARKLLIQCGIEYESNMVRIPPTRMVMFALDPTHPLLLEPNSNLTFTKTTSYWFDSAGKIEYDIGDLLKLSPSGGARLVIGTTPGVNDTHGTVAVCMDGRLIMQTFSSHQLTYNAMKPLWENYIYNALKVHFTGGQ